MTRHDPHASDRLPISIWLPDYRLRRLLSTLGRRVEVRRESRRPALDPTDTWSHSLAEGEPARLHLEAGAGRAVVAGLA